MTPSQLLQKWFEEVWNNGNETFIDEAMDKDVVIHGLDPTGTTNGIESFKQFYLNFRESFSYVMIDVKPLVSDNEFAAAYCQVSANHIKGNHIFFTGLCIIKVKNGKLIEGWNNFDFLKMYQQLGHILLSEIPE
jgi:predicted ester cyclase